MIDIIDLDFSKKRVEYSIEGDVLGYVIIEDVGDVINIIDVLVADAYRRRGIATKLFNYIFDMYRFNNIRFMLEVRKENAAAKKLYDKLGFKQIYVRRKYYKNEDGIIMELKV